VIAGFTAEQREKAEQVFTDFEWKPLAAASAVEVSRATRSGERVAVKVQRSQVAEIVARDTQAMLFLAASCNGEPPSACAWTCWRLLTSSPTPWVKNSISLTRHVPLSGSGPTVLMIKGYAFPGFTRTCALAGRLSFEEVHDRPVSDTASPMPRQELSDRLLASYLGQILRDGAFHADPYPGNIRLDKDGTLHLLDFGSIGILDA
jgi:ubiquinone biosynthesis protein